MAKKVIPMWNQEMNDAVQAKKVAFKVWLQNKANSSSHLRCTETRKSAALTVKGLNTQSWENFGHKLDSNHWQEWASAEIFPGGQGRHVAYLF